MLRGRLWAEGIFAVVSHAYHVGNNWAWSLALGGAKVQVRRVDYAAAREVERSTRAGEYKIRLQHEVGDLEDVDCPKCHSMQFWRRAPVLQGALAIVFSFLAGTVVPPWRRINVCKACGTEFRERYGLIGKARGFNFPMSFAEATLGDIPEMLKLCASADVDAEMIPLNWAVAGSAALTDSCADSRSLKPMLGGFRSWPLIPISSATVLGGSYTIAQSIGRSLTITARSGLLAHPTPKARSSFALPDGGCWMKNRTAIICSNSS